MQKDQNIDVRTKHQIIHLRAILKLRVHLLEKDIGVEKKKQVDLVIDHLSLEQLTKLRNITNHIADEILAEFHREYVIEK